MITEIDKNSEYMLLKHFRGKPVFVQGDNQCAKQEFRDKYENRNLLISPSLYKDTDLSAVQVRPLYFHIIAEGLARTRKSAIELCYCINEETSVPLECVDIIYIAGDATGTDGFATTIIIIAIPQTVFKIFPTPLMSAINYGLARQMIKAGVQNIDIDVYTHSYFMPLVNSLYNEQFVIPLSFKELLYLDFPAIKELAKKPRPEDSMIIPREIPEAVKWFREVYETAETEQKREAKLLESMLVDGWQIPECLRNLLWKRFSVQAGLEACRVTSQFYAAIKASQEEIWYQIQRWAQRNSYRNQQKLKAIIEFALENPSLCDCEHPLLQRFCSAGGCFMKGLAKEYGNPHLFVQI